MKEDLRRSYKNLFFNKIFLELRISTIDITFITATGSCKISNFAKNEITIFSL